MLRVFQIAIELCAGRSSLHVAEHSEGINLFIIIVCMIQIAM